MSLKKGAFCLLSSVLLALVASAASTPASHEYFVYFGTYTGFKFTRSGIPKGHSASQGIYVSRFNPVTGEMSDPKLAAEIRNPSFLAVHPNQRYLYSVSEDPLSVGPYLDKESFVSAYAIDKGSGKLKLLNTVSSGGTSSCYLSLDKSGKYLMVASFGSGNVSVIRIKEDGSLGEQTGFDQHKGKSVDPHYQAGPHAHSIDVSPDNRFAVSSDLGIDKVLVYRFDAASGKLAANNPPSVSIKPPSAGPRHFVFSPDGKFGYSISEMSGVITAYAWGADRGLLTEIQAVETIPTDFKLDKNAALLNPFHSAEIAIHPNGRFLYLSNRGPDTILVFSVEPGKGTLSKVEEVASRGVMPRQFAIDPTGSYLLAANEASDNVVVFRIDETTGRITPTRSSFHIDTPVCIVFVPVN